MKRKLLTVAAVALALSGYAQTKGTNTLSLGVSVQTSKVDYVIPSGTSTNEVKNNNFSLGYGHFINDRTKLAIELSYTDGSSTSSGGTQDNHTKGYGANVSYQKYYPIVKKFYAYAGGSGGYAQSKLTYDNLSLDRKYNTNTYNVGAYGGVTWFLTDRWAFETQLLSARAGYSSVDQSDGNGSGTVYKNKNTSFDLSTKGFINDLGFKIYLMF